MKTIKRILLATAIGLTTNAWSQFELRTIENESGIKTIAHCSSSVESIGADNSIFVLAKAVGGQAYMEILYPSFVKLYEDKHFEEMKTTFVFYTSSNEAHQFNTYSGGYRYGTLNNKWIYFNSDKLVVYCKKYNRVQISIDNNTWEFSLKNFTSCYNAIFK